MKTKLSIAMQAAYPCFAPLNPIWLFIRLLYRRQASHSSVVDAPSYRPHREALNKVLLTMAGLSTLLALPTAFAGNGVHINANAGISDTCVSVNDPQFVTIGGTDTNANITFRDTAATCDSRNKNTQMDSVLFYRPEGQVGVGATSLTLGGELYVNSGKLGLGDKGVSTGGRAFNGIRIGDAATLLNTTNFDAIALGVNAMAAADSSVAIGKGATTPSLGSRAAVAIGEIANAANTSVAIGYNARSPQSAGVSIGSGANTVGEYSVAIGSSASAGSSATVPAGNATAVGRLANASALQATAIGVNAKASKSSATAIGANTSASTDRATAVGDTSSASGEQATAIGTASTAGGDSSFAGGRNAKAYARNSVSIGVDSAIGDPSDGTVADEGVAIGRGAKVLHNFGIALGSLSTTDDRRAVAPLVLNGQTYTFDSTNTQGVLSIGNAARLRQMINLAPGSVNATSTDGINGAQLFAAFTEINKLGTKDRELEARLNSLPLGGSAASVLAAVGAGSSVGPTGELVLAPMRLESLGNDENNRPVAQPTTILGAIGALDQQIAKTDSVLEDAMLFNPDIGAFDAQHGDQATSRIANLAAGVNDTDAVNFGQLKDVSDIASAAGRAAAAAQTTANTATAAASTAQGAADAARVTANSALTAATAAQGTANTALTNGNAAQSSADAARGIANNALANANTAQGTANTALTAGNTAQRAADAAAGTANNALTAANTAQGTANTALTAGNNAQTAAAAAQGSATEALSRANTAQQTAEGAQAAAGVAGSQLAGIGSGETVVDRIKALGQSIADALGGGATVSPDGTVNAPGYEVASINADGTIAAPTRGNNTGEALSALGDNIGTVNNRVDGLAADSLLWNEEGQAFDASHGDDATSRIANLAAGVATTDAVNVGQLKTVSDVAVGAKNDAATAQNAANSAQSAASAAQGTANTALTTGNAAQSSADTAQGIANNALANANAAQGTANTALTAGNTAQRAADAAAGTADNALTAANTAQGTANTALTAGSNAQTAAAAAQGSATEALSRANTAQQTAEGAQAAAGVAGSQLAGIGSGETVVDRIKALGQSIADALGGDATVSPDGTVNAPGYEVASINADGTIAAPTTGNNTGEALSVLGDNIGTVNNRVDGLAADSLLWNEEGQAFDASHGDDATSRIANLAAGVATTDAVNVGQLNTVSDVANTAQSSAVTAQGAAAAAQGTATDALTRANTAQQTADDAKSAAGAAGSQLAGIGAGETVVDRIKALGESIAGALGSGATVSSDGTVSAPSYEVANINADGTLAAPTTATNTGAALSALGDNIGTVNNRVDDLAADSLLWNEEGQAFDASHGEEAASRIANLAAGVATTDAVNVGQLKTVSDVAVGAQNTATSALAAAGAAQDTATGALTAGNNAQGTANDALERANNAQQTADDAKSAAGAAGSQLAGIGAGETVVDRIKALGESIAGALGGGATVSSDGTVGAPGYEVAHINADGTLAAPTTATNAGAALSVLGDNIGTVNNRVDDLAADSLLWNEEGQAFDASHGNEATSRIANLAAGVATTDAVNVGQLKTVSDVADGAKSDAAAAQSAANAAQGTANTALTAGNNAQTAAAAAQGTATDALTRANTAQQSADGANAAAGVAGSQLAGIGSGETVLDRIKALGQSIAGALGGGASVSPEGIVSAPGYEVASINADGTIAAPTTATGTDEAVSALSNNIGTVNNRVNDLAADSLLWSEEGQAFDASHGEDATSRIANLAAGVATTDAVNVGQLKTVGDVADGAKSDAAAAQSTGTSALTAANNAQSAADNAFSSATNAGDAAKAAQSTADTAKATSDVAARQLGGFAQDETVIGRIGSAVKSATDAVGDFVSRALGGGAAIDSNGQPVSPTYAISQIAEDGSTQPSAQPIRNVADALSALDGNVNKVNGAIQNQGAALGELGQNVQGLRNDSLLWDESVGGFSASHDDEPNNRIVNLAAGSASTDAVNKGQLDGVDNTANSALSIADLAKEASDTHTNQLAGFGADETVAGRIAQAEKAASQSLADTLGGGAKVNADGSLRGPSYGVSTLGPDNQVSVVKAPVATVGAAIEMLDGNIAAVSNNVKDVAQNVGTMRDQLETGKLGLVRQDAATQDITVAKDSGGSRVDVSGTDGPRTLAGIKDGAVNQTSTEAVNGAQLNTVTQRVQELDKQSSGMAVDTKGDGSDRPTVTVGSQAVALGANASATGAKSVATGSGSKATGTGSTAIGGDAKATADNSVAIGNASQATRANTVSVGAAGAERQVTNVAAATSSTDAVNLGQATRLSQQSANRAIRESNAYTDSQVGQLRRDTYAGIASAMAMAALPAASTPGRSMISMGTSVYEGQSAIAVGLSGRTADGQWSYKASGSGTTQGSIGVSVGVGYEW